MTAKRILAPIDGSERSEEVLSLVGALGRDSGATVRLLRVYPVPQRVVGTNGKTIAYADQEMAGLTAAGQGALEHAEARLHGVPVERAVRFGDAVEEIANEAEAFDADVIVLTESRPSILRRIFAPCVASRVAARTTVPTVVLRVPAA
jgi:nucleotide-binding universal stress UspA family protein